MIRTLRIPLEVGVDAGRSLESRPWLELEYDAATSSLTGGDWVIKCGDVSARIEPWAGFRILGVNHARDEKLLDLLDYLAAQESEKDREAEAVYGKVSNG